MKVLFVGNLVPDELSVEIKENSLAGNKFQNNLIRSLKKTEKVDIVSFVAARLTEEQISKLKKHEKKEQKYFYKGNNIIKNVIEFRKYIKNVSIEYDLVMAYNVAYPWLFLSKIIGKVKSTLILADFSDSCSYKNLILKIYAWVCKQDIRTYDNVVGLSKNVNRFLKNKQKFICIQGGIDTKLYKDVSPTPSSEPLRIMYSGNLSNVTGVDILIESFKNFNNKNVELIITGRGDLQEFVENSISDKIKYYGSVPYEEYLRLLNSANILVNPRNMDLKENENNFPSKVFEYLAVGKVVVSTKFIGWEDFKDNFYFCDSTIESLTESLNIAIKQYEEKYDFYFTKNTKKAFEYDWDNQAKKIIDM